MKMAPDEGIAHRHLSLHTSSHIGIWHFMRNQPHSCQAALFIVLSHALCDYKAITWLSHENSVKIFYCVLFRNTPVSEYSASSTSSNALEPLYNFLTADWQ